MNFSVLFACAGLTASASGYANPASAAGSGRGPEGSGHPLTEYSPRSRMTRTAASGTR